MGITQQFKQIYSQNITAGMELVNIGKIDKVELYPTAKLVNIVCTQEKVMSAAFYWYRYDVLLYII